VQSVSSKATTVSRSTPAVTASRRALTPVSAEAGKSYVEVLASGNGSGAMRSNRVEGFLTAPERDVVSERSLRLQPDQVLDCVEGRHTGAFEQKLPRERGAVELPTVETIRTHRVSVWQCHARNNMPH
jgi:hypothetical protein